MRLAILALVLLTGCATLDDGALARLESAAVKTYRDTAALVVLGSMSKESGAKAKEEADRIAKQYAAVAILKGLPQESAAVKEARLALETALR